MIHIINDFSSGGDLHDVHIQEIESISEHQDSEQLIENLDQVIEELSSVHDKEKASMISAGEKEKKDPSQELNSKHYRKERAPRRCRILG